MLYTASENIASIYDSLLMSQKLLLNGLYLLINIHLYPTYYRKYTLGYLQLSSFIPWGTRRIIERPNDTRGKALISQSTVSFDCVLNISAYTVCYIRRAKYRIDL